MTGLAPHSTDGLSQAWRPVQYLGTKLRSLDHIVAAVESLTVPGDRVWDPFTGSTVVAQAIASTGRRVLAHDTQQAAATFGKALLGVGRRDGRSLDPQELLALVRGVAQELSGSEAAEFWQKFIRIEDEALASEDAEAVDGLNAQLPQRWRSSSDARPPVPVPGSPGMVTTFAGTYFGVRQALRLDVLRASVAKLDNEIGPWETSTLLTGLCHAASQSVCSAGKHFAQPLRALNGSRAFVLERMLRDRSVDIDAALSDALEAIYRIARTGVEQHEVERRDALGVVAQELTERNVTCVYADPPYTAQQYSRFYHVLDTLVLGTPRKLQIWRGEITRGLYPEDKYHSPFCSRRQAPDAFRRLIRVARRAGASLAISYSSTANGNSGNARMVELDEIRSWVSEAYGGSNVDVVELGHAYRQFNTVDAAVSGRDEPELLLVATHD